MQACDLDGNIHGSIQLPQVRIEACFSYKNERCVIVHQGSSSVLTRHLAPPVGSNEVIHDECCLKMWVCRCG